MLVFRQFSYVAQAGLQLRHLQSQLPWYLDYRCVPPRPAIPTVSSCCVMTLVCQSFSGRMCVGISVSSDFGVSELFIRQIAVTKCYDQKVD